MTQTSSRFKLPYIMPGQAQKHVTHNEALRALDALLHVSVVSRDIDSPPTSPAEGEGYLIGTAPNGVFANKVNYLAVFVDGAWMFYPPTEGLIVNVEIESLCVIWRAGQWAEFGGVSSIDAAALTFQTFGINGTADDSNRLLLQSDASLFNHNGAGHQLKINKADEADTASLLFQNGFSGRAEIGLAGEDNFSVKVSPDGAAFQSAMTVHQQSAEVSFPNTPHLLQPVIFNMFGDGGRFSGKPEPLDIRLEGPFVLPNYINSVNGSILSEGDKYIESSDNFGGSRGLMPSHLEVLAQRFKPGASETVMRYGTEFYTMSITAGAGTSRALAVDGITAYLAVDGPRFPLPSRYTLSYWIRVTAGVCLIGNAGRMRLFIDGVEIESNAVIEANGEWHHIERVVSNNPNQFVGYVSNLYSIYTVPDGSFELASPALFPGTLSTDAQQPTALVSSLSAFM